MGTLDNFVFMKVGRHSGEDFSDILDRKRGEKARSGSIWWGYGGPTLHPVRAVQPFIREALSTGDQPPLVMQVIVSNHDDSGAVAVEYSSDGVNWRRVPDGIEVRSSRFALVLDEITEGTLEDIDLSSYRVGIGPSEGINAAEYVRGRVDKGCFRFAGKPNTPVARSIVRQDLTAKLKAPFAVMLR